MKFTRYILVAIALLAGGLPVAAQTSLTIADALPPYDLTATLLANGHFSLSTRYTGTSKTIIYREDGSGNRPVNYTSHIHFKVDDLLFQLPYELNPITREAPPEHPLTVTQLYRDTVANRPRVNARMFGVMPDGDTIRFIFSMMPVKRPSGGFVRLSATVQNSTPRKRSVGTLMLIDTKIGDNDKAPIITSFGYKDIETEFSSGTAPFMPEFWLATEGTPTNPGLTARGNLRASDLIEPDLFLFGNWADYTSQGIRGLASTQWKERTASGLPYTDSAVLLLWDSEDILAGLSKLLASTEIGIVDSLGVAQGGGGGWPFGLAGGGGIGGSGCLSVDTAWEVPCGDPNYHPYSPDTLQNIYLVTNTGTATASNVRLVIAGTVPPGLSVTATTRPVVPGTLDANMTGVATVSVVPTPRLQAQSYTIPIALVANASDTVLRDQLSICVPGLMGSIMVDDGKFLPVCPNVADTIDVDLNLEGVRCLPITSLKLLGAPPAINDFSLVTPLPSIVPANGRVKVRVRYQPTVAGPAETVQLAAEVRDFESLTPGDTTFAFARDTATITGTGKDAEFAFARTTDTLDFGSVCVGDTVVMDWKADNIGGCSLVLTRDTVTLAPGEFSLTPGSLPATVDRAQQKLLAIRFTPTAAGVQQGLLILDGDALPFRDTLVLRGKGDLPRYDMAAAGVLFDTICPGASHSLPLRLTNPTACPVVIDTVEAPGGGFTAAPNRGFTIPPFSSVDVQVQAKLPAAPGTYGGMITVRSGSAGNNAVAVKAVVASRTIQADTQVDFGDVRVNRSGRMPVTIHSTGDAGVEISRVYVTGGNASEFTLVFPPGTTFPLYLAPGTDLVAQIDFVPSDLENRQAFVAVEATPGKACTVPEPIVVKGRGVLPVIDVPRRSLDLGRVCVGGSLDTVIAVRNLGNAGLTISGLKPQGSADFQISEALPVTIGAGESRNLRVRFTPTLLGDLSTTLTIDHDGEWFTPPDTLVRIAGAGILCGTLSVDTVHAVIGDLAPVPVRIRIRPGLALQPADIAPLMNRSGKRSFQFSIGNSARNLRFAGVSDTTGMAAGLAPATAITPTGITVRSDGTAGDLRSDNLFALLKADVLLGDGSRTLLPLTLGEFAGGYADLDLHDGLLVAEYCAIDRRYVDASGIAPFSRPAQQPLPAGGAIEFYLPQGGEASLWLVDPLGRSVATIFNGTAGGGLHSVPLPSMPLSSGMYTLVLQTGGGRYTTPVVLVR